MKYNILPRQYSVVVLGGPSDINYSASCQVFVYGDKGFMYSINGEDFYKCMSEEGNNLIRDLKVKSLEGYVSPTHAKLMKYKLRKIATVTETSKGDMNGIPLVWVVVTAK